MSKASYPNLDASDLLPGDVCMMMGAGEVSKLIAWVGDSPYSHAFLIFDQTQLAEAALSGIQLRPIAARLADVTEALMIDVYRPSDTHGEAFTPAQLSAMQAKVRDYIGLPYARNDLVQLAVMAALRNKLPDSESLRWVMRIAMSHFMKDDPTQMVCSEFVYRVVQEANVLPAGSIRPTIISSMRSHVPLPPVDTAALIKELEQIFHPTQVASNAQPAASVPPQRAALQAYQNKEPVGAELDEMFEAARARLLPPQASAPVLIVPDPNPKTVMPVDLATSPSLRFIGRLKLG
jgi:hypothetical protein